MLLYRHSLQTAPDKLENTILHIQEVFILILDNSKFF